MTRCIEPGEPGFVVGAFFAFGLRVAENLAFSVGEGLPLVGALRERFPEIEPGLAGWLAGTVGQGGRAVAAIGVDTPLGDAPRGTIPTVPGDVFAADARGDRYRIETRWKIVDEDGSVTYQTAIGYASETDTLGELFRRMEEQAKADAEWTRPELIDELQVWTMDFAIVMQRF